MNFVCRILLACLATIVATIFLVQDAVALEPIALRCEYLDNPLGLDITAPRLSWKIKSDQRGVTQVAYRILVASSPQKLSDGEADLWDSGKVHSDQTTFVDYEGRPLESRQQCFWKVLIWCDDNVEPRSSETANWSMGLLKESDWTSRYISYLDKTPIHTDTETLFLPAARQYRKEFSAAKQIKRATIYATALGIYELHLNGSRVGDALFAPGWTDYRQRAYYNTYDVTNIVKQGENAFGAWVADGWYSGYIGFGLLTGMGTEKTGRYIYGKTPAFMAQLEIEYTDGTSQTIGTDDTWKVTGDGPIQQADILMGELYDARDEQHGWSQAGYDDSDWDQAISPQENGEVVGTFYQFRNPTDASQRVKKVGEQKDLGFIRPELQSFPGVPVRVTQEITARSLTEREPGKFIFDLGQNFAGTIRLKLSGPSGARVQIRYGEMLHPDGRLMTENLRKARATDVYICSGKPGIETYEPRFTYHGFRYVELTNFPGTPSLATVTGLVLHSDTPLASQFECSDKMVNQLFQNVVWTQRANFLDLPTDCPQRDERMGWTGDAQAYVATAAYNANIGAFYTKWLRDLMESQRPSGAFPGYAPFPFQHGWDFGSAWSDAGVICPWTIWQFYGDTRVIDDCWEPMTRFMEWRDATSVNNLGVAHGNAWGDWLSQGEDTPLEYIDTIYYAISLRMMAEMAEATGRDQEATAYRQQLEATKSAFQDKYLSEDGFVNIDTQTAQALALFADVLPDDNRESTGRHLATMLAENGNHMATGFLGTRPLLPALSASGHHDLATFLLQSREFPSWGYEISNGATSIWERWDSYTKEDAFGRHNAAMNSFSHYAFGAVCEWMFGTLAGIQTDGPGFKKITIRPIPPSPGSNANQEPIRWVRASYDSIHGTITSEWKVENDTFQINVQIPANTTAEVYIPAREVGEITEGGVPLANNPHVKVLRQVGGSIILAIGSGNYHFVADSAITPASVAFQTSKPQDKSTNPHGVNLEGATKLYSWDFRSPLDVAKWLDRKSVEVQRRDGNAYLVATGEDPRMSVQLDQPIGGTIAIELRAMPKRGSSSQFFWATSKTAFNGKQQQQRTLRESDQVNSYLFAIPNEGPIEQIRFDPFASYDQYARQDEMLIESITIYQLAD